MSLPLAECTIPYKTRRVAHLIAASLLSRVARPSLAWVARSSVGGHTRKEKAPRRVGQQFLRSSSRRLGPPAKKKTVRALNRDSRHCVWHDPARLFRSLSVKVRPELDSAIWKNIDKRCYNPFRLRRYQEFVRRSLLRGDNDASSPHG